MDRGRGETLDSKGRTCLCLCIQENRVGGFPILGVPFMGVPLRRIILFWGIYQGPPNSGKYDINL